MIDTFERFDVALCHVSTRSTWVNLGQNKVKLSKNQLGGNQKLHHSIVINVVVIKTNSIGYHNLVPIEKKIGW
jgi:hypothetical protein